MADVRRRAKRLARWEPWATPVFFSNGRKTEGALSETKIFSTPGREAKQACVWALDPMSFGSGLAPKPSTPVTGVGVGGITAGFKLPSGLAAPATANNPFSSAFAEPPATSRRELPLLFQPRDREQPAIRSGLLNQKPGTRPTSRGGVSEHPLDPRPSTVAHSPALSDHAARPKFPEGTQRLFWFFFFNFLSCQIIMDSPIFLYAESLGASATVMGLIAGMTPLMVIFQIPAAAHVGRWGYKFFIATGWSLGFGFLCLDWCSFRSQRCDQPASQLALVLCCCLPSTWCAALPVVHGIRGFAG
ncbi:MAG: hypothetical protein Ct9H300mP7_6260 [Verrucomicrobiota bacterium]|nr:MAG: hypothetical protein Ct9H300mP7_6260 [Verrucomicrobiota bacterium]